MDIDESGCCQSDVSNKEVHTSIAFYYLQLKSCMRVLSNFIPRRIHFNLLWYHIYVWLLCPPLRREEGRFEVQNWFSILFCLLIKCIYIEIRQQCFQRRNTKKKTLFQNVQNGLWFAWKFIIWKQGILVKLFTLSALLYHSKTEPKFTEH